MANIVREELWKHPGFPGMIVVTTNATITTKGALAMGRGAALQAKQRVPGIDYECAGTIRPAGREYGFQVVREPTDEKVGFGIFQVKVHFRQQAELELIYRSTSMLDEYARRHPDTQIRMNFPGIGAGRLSRDKVEPLLALLPDTVTICYR